ncbi:MAG: hypothetical protein SO069_07205 [Succinivibrio sp.]|nr:hypothetical protein [Succinivibrio sp.]
MSVIINKIAGVFNGKLIVLNSLISPNHDDVYSIVLSEYETLTKRQIIKEPERLTDKNRKELEILIDKLSDKNKSKLESTLGVKGKDFLEYNYVSKNKELEKNGARLGVCHWDCILNLEIAKLIVAANLYGNFTLNFALPYLKKILSKTEFNKVCF